MLKFFSIIFGIIVGLIGVYFVVMFLIGLFFVMGSGLKSMLIPSLMAGVPWVLLGLTLIYISHRSFKKDFKEKKLQK